MHTLASLLQGIDLADATVAGDPSVLLSQPVNFDMVAEGLGAEGLAWVKPGNEDRLPAGQPVAALVCTPESRAKIADPARIRAWVLTPSPRRVFAQLVQQGFAPQRPARIEPTAQIHPSAQIGAGCYIGHYVVIEEGCMIGERVQVLHHTVLMAGTEVGADTTIGSHCTIGAPGFGYERDADGRPMAVPQVGRVRIGQRCHIHSNTCIDRAALGFTQLHDDVAVDNLVHIAHGAVIGPRTFVIANAMVAGSARIGADGWVAPSVNILNGITLGDRLMTGMGATVVKSAGDDQTLVGAPAEPIEQFKAWLRARKRLTEGRQD